VLSNLEIGNLNLSELLRHYERLFPTNGTFILMKGKELKKVVKKSRVPNMPGIYLIFEKKNGKSNLVYVGRAGTLMNNGEFKRQGLNERITNRQSGLPRFKFFGHHLKRCDALNFRWFVTFTDYIRVIPSKAECDIMQAYFNEHGFLPKWNSSI